MVRNKNEVHLSWSYFHEEDQKKADILKWTRKCFKSACTEQKFHLNHLSLSVSYTTVSWFLQQPHALLNCFQILNQYGLFQSATQSSVPPSFSSPPHYSFFWSLFFPTFYPSIARTLLLFPQQLNIFGYFTDH